MSDLYSKISRPEHRPRSRRGRGLYVLLAAAVLVLVIGSLWAWRVLSIRPQYYQLVSMVSESTTYAYRHGGARARSPEGGDVLLSGDNVYAIYNGISAWGPSWSPLFPPGEAPQLSVDYPDGACLELWPMRDEGGQPQGHGVTVQFRTGDGETVLMRFEGANFSHVLRWVAPDAEGNAPWPG